MRSTAIPTTGRTVRTKTAFRLSYGVATTISATPATIWALLTKAADFPRWNSTIKEITGQIAPGQTIQLRATIAPERVFKLAISDLTPERGMTWRDGRAPFFTGVRTFNLTPHTNGTTDFTMVETFSGIMLPMIAGSLPDFTSTFEQYAADLKKAAEQH